MKSANSSARHWFTRANTTVPPVNRLSERVRQYFDLHLGVTAEKLSCESLRPELPPRKQKETVNENELGLARRRFNNRPPLTAEDIRFHAWLSERLAVLDYERHGLWPKVRRFLVSNRLVRWLART
jgi:hypothetical protein